MAAAALLVNVGVGGFLVLLFRSFRSDPGRVNRNITRHTRQQVNTRLGERMGPATWRLYGMIGDQLDQKSGWTRSMDVVLGVLRDHPSDVLDFLVETHGEEQIRALLSRLPPRPEEQP